MFDSSSETRTRRRNTDVAYGAYLWIAVVLLVVKGLEWLYGKPATSEAFATWQGIGMLVVLPLSITAIIAAVFAGKATLKLWSSWAREPGVVLLAVLLLAMLSVFALVEVDALARLWLTVAAAVYMIAAIAIATRWFLFRRTRRNKPD